jgi:hypothetical protein
MEGAGSIILQTSVTTHPVMQHQIPEEQIPQPHHWENSKTHIKSTVYTVFIPYVTTFSSPSQ